jgi:hypothetical protein
MLPAPNWLANALMNKFSAAKIETRSPSTPWELENLRCLSDL